METLRARGRLAMLHPNPLQQRACKARREYRGLECRRNRAIFSLLFHPWLVCSASSWLSVALLGQRIFTVISSWQEKQDSEVVQEKGATTAKRTKLSAGGDTLLFHAKNNNHPPLVDLLPAVTPSLCLVHRPRKQPKVLHKASSAMQVDTSQAATRHSIPSKVRQSFLYSGSLKLRSRAPKRLSVSNIVGTKLPHQITQLTPRTLLILAREARNAFVFTCA